MFLLPASPFFVSYISDLEFSRYLFYYSVQLRGTEGSGPIQTLSEMAIWRSHLWAPQIHPVETLATSLRLGAHVC